MSGAGADEEIIITDEEWSEYKRKFDKVYEDKEEDQTRRGIYLKTKILIKDHNKKYDAGEVTYTMGINQFADMKSEEKACGCMRGGIKKKQK